MHKTPRRPGRHSMLALAVLAVLAVLSGAARADITSSGNVFVFPANLSIGPGNTDLGSNALQVGSSGLGMLQVAAGSLLRTGALSLGPSGTGNGHGTALITGAGTRVDLTGDGFSDGVLNRLGVGEWGYGSLTVADGAVLDGRADASACLGLNHNCHNFIGNAAGSTGVLTITGAGSQASFLRAFVVGGLAVFHPPIDSFTFGTPGGTTQGRVNVLAGAKLTTDSGQVGAAPGGSSPLGNERSIADVSIDGAGSLWHVTGGTIDSTAAIVSMGNHRNSVTSLSVTGGGELRFEGKEGQYSGLQIGNNGGRSDVLVSGNGSQISFLSDAGTLQVGRSLGGGTLEVKEGGLISGAFYVSVGRDAGTGNMTIDGPGSTLLINGTASAAANVTPTSGVLDIGRGGGRGTVSVTGGGTVHIWSDQGATVGVGLTLGRDANSSGTLNIRGPGSTIRLESVSSVPGGGPLETPNPAVRIGRDGSGTLTISDGGKLLLDGGAVSLPSARRSTNVFIGGSGDTTVGGTGLATVTGAGSEIRVTGGDTFVGVAIGPQSNGTLIVSDGGSISAMGMNVGRAGGIGVLKLDGGTLDFSGQQTAGNLAGGFLSIGSGGGIGIATMDHGSIVKLKNLDSSGAGFGLGGNSVYPGGDGSLTMNGGSKILMQSAPGLGVAVIGNDGSGFMRMRGASELDTGGSPLMIGRLTGSDGTLLVSEGSTITAGWVGVGRRQTAGGDVDGGTATMVLNNSTLTATQIVIGTNGFLGGNGTIVGDVFNHGIFSPGNSPGTMVIEGSFTAASGNRLIMEVQADGRGGFATDRVIFGDGTALDLAALNVEFRFLGATDPNAFQASGGFDVDTFFQEQMAGGGTADVPHGAFATASFAAQADSYAISSFSFSAEGGASFSAVAVPEPGSWLMLAGGLLVLAWRRKLIR